MKENYSKEKFTHRQIQNKLTYTYKQKFFIMEVHLFKSNENGNGMFD